MADLAITFTFAPNTTASSTQVNTDFSDVATYINNRNGGTATWDNMNITATVSNPATIKSSAATTELAIDNTATDGDPQITFKLGGTAQFSMGVDDSASDVFKLSKSAALGTSDILSISDSSIISTAPIYVPNGSAATPGLSFANDTNTGIYALPPDNIVFSAAGGIAFRITDQVVAIYSSTTETFNFTGAGLMPIGSSKTYDAGTALIAFDDMFADDFTNVADIEFFDMRKNKQGEIETLDDCAIIKSIKPKKDSDGKIIFNEKGNAFWDDDTLPQWIFHEDKRNPGNLARDAQGRPWISLRILSALSLGAIGQLINRVEALESK